MNTRKMAVRGIETIARIVFAAVMLPAPALSRAEGSPLLLKRVELSKQAKQEANVPVRPGEPGGQPFWNVASRKFMYAPAFDFPAVDGANSYRFTARSGADFQDYIFTAPTPWSNLGPIWDKLPVGMVDLVVEALDGGTVLQEVGRRRFYHDSPFRGPYREAVIDYRQSARKLLEYTFHQPYVQYWLKNDKPDPWLGHYSYASKVIGAVIEAMTLAIREDMPFKEQARIIAEKAASYLIATSVPEGSPYAGFPLTYDLTQVKTPVAPAKKHNGKIMVFYPAEVGLQYLDLYKVTGNPALLQAARRIADTYVRTQLPSGTWPVMVDVDTGESGGEAECIPVHIVRFLHELARTYGLKEYEKSCRAAFDWIMANPVSTFNWSAQFEDGNPFLPPYANLSARGAALYFTIYLDENFRGDAAMMRLSREILRFSEDQFVIWERPAPGLRADLFDPKTGRCPQDQWSFTSTPGWITPSVLEQYGFYLPVGTSGAVALEAYLEAWKAGGDVMDLAKAVSLANNMTYLQMLQGDGGIPTQWVTGYSGCYGWVNNLASQARALLAAADALKGVSFVTVGGGARCAHQAADEPCPYAEIAGGYCPYTGNALSGGGKTAEERKPAPVSKKTDVVVPPLRPLATAVGNAMSLLKKADGGYAPGRIDGPLAAYFSEAYMSMDGASPTRGIVYPARLHGFFIRTFLSYHAYTGEREWLLRARDLADWNIAHSTPASGMYPHLAYSTFEKGNPGGHKDQSSIQPDKAAFMGNSYLLLYEATGEKIYLEAARKVAETLVARQREDGSWPFRVVPGTGVVTQDRGGAPVHFVEFFERMLQHDDKAAYRQAHDKALAYMIARNIEQGSWGTYHEDVGMTKGTHLSAEPMCYTADYLFRHAPEHPEYIEMGRRVLKQMEDKLVFTEGHGAAPAPAVAEQSGLEHIMPGHTARYGKALIDLYLATHDEEVRRRALSVFNAVTYMQNDEGMFRTFFYDVKRKADNGGPKRVWFSQHLFSVYYLLEALSAFPSMPGASSSQP